MPEFSNPANEASTCALTRLYAALDSGEHFRMEAGAGAGKTFSLVKALEYVIKSRGANLLRRNQKIACITYTNVARDEIRARTDGHPVIFAETIHTFCWALMKSFQNDLRECVGRLPKWSERLSAFGGIGKRRLDYDLGYPSVKEGQDFLSLSHDDVLALMVILLEKPKFRTIFASKFPILLIDEYQDTDAGFAGALKGHFLTNRGAPLIGFFGDHWQKIYGEGCGSMEHPGLTVINVEANFRSTRPVVEALNRMRPELPQQVSDLTDEGSVQVYHTNNWSGVRRTGQHWQGDLPSNSAHQVLTSLITKLKTEGWEFSSKTKILMLTHSVLASEQGYAAIVRAFDGRNDQFIKKEDPYLEFFLDVLEPACAAYEMKRYGEMFSVLKPGIAKIDSKAEKQRWAQNMATLICLRATGSVGEVVDHLRKSGRPRLSDKIENRETELEKPRVAGAEEPSWMARTRAFKEVPYQQVIALDRFVDGHTPFSTKHGVKGAEFENVLVVVGRGWNQYDFNRMLEIASGPVIPDDKDFFERNRNLFYVACSRPKKRLAVLFTQFVTPQAMATLRAWFGNDVLQPWQ